MLHETKVVAEIEQRSSCDYTVFINGRTSGVSSGSMWGSCFSVSSYEDAIKEVRESVRKHNEWCDSYRGERGEIIRLGHKYKSTIFVNGKKLSDVNSSSLLNFV